MSVSTEYLSYAPRSIFLASIKSATIATTNKNKLKIYWKMQVKELDF